jgi:uncharacterized membrane protein (UPF0127 family)
MKRWKLLDAVYFIVLALLFFVVIFELLINTLDHNLPEKGSVSFDERARVCLKENCFNVDVARTPQQMRYGLMYRDHLDPDGGLLIYLGEERVYADWMKNCLIPLDIFWIDSDMRVVHISKNTPPCQKDPCPTYSAPEKVGYILELNGGMADSKGITEGDTLEIKV